MTIVFSAMGIYLGLQLSIMFFDWLVRGYYSSAREGRIYKYDENGLFKLKKINILVKIFFPGLMLARWNSSKKDASEDAMEDAGAWNKTYDNRFANKSIRAVYDKVYADERVQYVIRQARKDVECNVNKSNSFKVPFEKALYQNVFMKSVSTKSDTTEVIQKLHEKNHNLSPGEAVSDEIFEKVLSNTRNVQ